MFCKVFIIIMIVLEIVILPMVGDIGGAEATGGSQISGVSGIALNPQGFDPAAFGLPLLIMILAQSFFAGLVIGQIAEGTIKAGLKHSFILLAIALLIKTGAGIFA